MIWTQLAPVASRSSRWNTLTGPRLVTRHLSSKPTRHAFIALGSNLGDRIKNIENACKHLDNSGLRVSRTSHLYETKPMYVEDQDTFINGVCRVEVDRSISPLELLNKLKAIENSMGRVKVIDKGPRNIDLDILLYGQETHESDELSIPHKSMLEREFVLRPLCDLIPAEKHPYQSNLSYAQHLAKLDSDSSMSTVTALGKSSTIKASNPARKTQIMSILNMTPDSFSDGGKNSPSTDLTMTTVEQHIRAGASIIDVGGYSTRPNAQEISSEEETSRVVPIIQAIRTRFPDIHISIDTFRHDVAEEAVKAGADIVNDVSAGTLDSKMLTTVARLGCTYIAMHMRGNPNSMMKLNQYDDGVIPGIANELLTRVEAAENAGIRRWRIILDPGIGFAKNQAQNLEILRRFNELKSWPGLKGFPWLIGASRKAFIGRITGVQHAHERIWGTAAAVTASIQGGADIVRVHDVEEMSQVAKMADAIWRS